MNKEEKIEMLRACLVVREHLFNNFDLIFIESGLCWQIAHQLNRDLFPNRYSLIISDVLSRYFRIWSKFFRKPDVSFTGETAVVQPSSFMGR